MPEQHQPCPQATEQSHASTFSSSSLASSPVRTSRGPGV